MESASELLTRLALVLAVISPFAAEARELDWAESVKLLLENNADLRSAEASFRATESLEGTARAGFLPAVTGTLSATRTGTGGGTDVSVPAGNQYSATLRGDQNLFSGFSDRGNLSRARANTRAAAAALRIAKAKASYDLKSAYEGLRYAQNARTLALDIVKRRAANLDLVQLRFQSGRENKGSVLLSKAYLAQAKYESLQTENGESVARVTLARVVGLDDTDDTLAASAEVPTAAPPAAAPDFRKLAAETPDHAQVAAQEDAADAAVTVAHSGFFPTLGVFGTYGRKDDEFFPNAPDRWTVGANLTFPLFSGLKDYYSTKNANASYASAIGSRVSTDRGLLVKLRQAFHDYVEAVAKADVDASFRDAAQLRAEIARTQYNNGLIAFTDWDLIENDLIARQKSYLDSLRNRVTAEAAWEQAQGTGVVP
ncbi:MAG: TolC family protein [Bdellovibrionales bacterium]|nr:TolC family protein [Bdellovibrionales bacterium]